MLPKSDDEGDKRRLNEIVFLMIVATSILLIAYTMDVWPRLQHYLATGTPVQATTESTKHATNTPRL